MNETFPFFSFLLPFPLKTHCAVLFFHVGGVRIPLLFSKLSSGSPLSLFYSFTGVIGGTKGRNSPPLLSSLPPIHRPIPCLFPSSPFPFPWRNDPAEHKKRLWRRAILPFFLPCPLLFLPQYRERMNVVFSPPAFLFSRGQGKIPPPPFPLQQAR